ncbi:MAG TPA: crosslink repair DNA glycosylase YcaQ family protein, partial [Bacillota bacterium]|nr:crosslink repair DNA glycosylase YcaQ family protein [Bacillota bacterium]
MKKNKMKQLEITLPEARRFLIHYQGLDNSNPWVGERGILEYLKRVGCIQYDPLNVVGRNPDLVLQSRIPGYSPAVLEKLLYDDRSLIDGWDKMMAIYLREDWPLFQRLRKQKGEEIIWILQYRKSSEALNVTGEVRKILMEKGPLPSTKLQLGAAGKGRWGHRNLAGAAMDYMFNIGELGIWRKKNSQKIYDLIENLLPRELLEAPDPFLREQD